MNTKNSCVICGNKYKICSYRKDGGDETVSYKRVKLSNNKVDVFIMSFYNGNRVDEDKCTAKYCPFCGEELKSQK